MSKKYTENEKQLVLTRYENNETINSIATSTGISRSTIYSWIKTYNYNKTHKVVNIQNFRGLEFKVKRLETIMEIQQKSGCRTDDPLKVRLQAIEELQGQYSVRMMCEALNVATGTFYNHIYRNKRNSTWYAKKREIRRLRIQQIYDDNNQIYGAAKIAAVMRNEGDNVSVEMVRELMRDMGLISIRQDAKDLYDKEMRRCKNYLNQQFDVKHPDEVWVSDITYYRFKDTNYYICVILDLFARKVIGYKIGKSNSTQLAKSTFRSAYEQRTPSTSLIFHTDRGSNYRSKTFCGYLKSLNVQQSFSRAHVPYDNSVMESFFSNLKREELYRTKYRSEKEFRTAVDNYITFYNEQRPHAKNGYKTPVQKELLYHDKKSVSLENTN